MKLFSQILMVLILVYEPAYAEESLESSPSSKQEIIAESAIEQTDIEEELISEIRDAVDDGAVVTAEQYDDLSPIGMYHAADWVVKTVMVILLAASVMTWAILMAKWLQFTSARRELKTLQQHVQTAISIDELTVKTNRPLANNLFDALFNEIELSSQQAAMSDEGIKERVASRFDRVLAYETQTMSAGMGVLATVGAVAPFVGLFGTVWGIMNAFIAIAHSQTTNLAVVAPGIAEALLATAMGLVAAIPAVVIYNHFSRALTAYRARVTDVVTGLMILLSRSLDAEESAVFVDRNKATNRI